MGLNPKLTLEDIARMSGVSRSTVSRVINQQPNVSEPVRQRVMDVIHQTGFHPNLAARSLASQRSYIIGLVIPRSVQNLFSDPYIPLLTQGIAQTCNQNNHTLALFLFNTEEDEHKLLPRIRRPGLVDGLIALSTHADDELLTQLRQGDIPYVITGRPMNLPDASYVDVDNLYGAFLAVRHLIHTGYRHIGTITGPLKTTTGMDRLEGYKKALFESFIEYDPRLIVEGDFTQSGGYYAALKILPHQPDAIFIASDYMVLGAIQAFQENGLTVPDDIAVVGFDDLPISSQMSPSLTTIRQPIRPLGAKLVETLLDIIDNGSQPPRRVIFGTELVIRESCGAHQKMVFQGDG